MLQHKRLISKQSRPEQISDAEIVDMVNKIYRDLYQLAARDLDGLGLASKAPFSKSSIEIIYS